MSRSLLLIVSADPNRSHRAAEAVRIAAGVAAWEKVEVSVCLRQKAAALLLDPPNEPETLRHLEILTRENRPIFVEGSSRNDASTRVPQRAINTRQLAALAAQCDCVLHY